ncbi:cytochrome P450 [Myriangium duriaei CBS 260.36]|uniref:Cytochrome P450 n=1 Tax=Myriangium duriaei CBS 260.36 TaxID=1168546 RepID=A0A9P4MIA6_9PEZI|nr:cytochrome P450 [Myriangium duriaei CBS 260.36]
MATETAHPPSFPFPRAHTFEPPTENIKLREQCPVSQVELYDGSKAWIVMKHQECCDVLSSNKLSADRRHAGYPEIHGGGHKAKEARPTFVNLDDPDHKSQRDMIQAAFDPEAVRKLRPMMQNIVDRNIDKLVQKGKDSQPVDFMANFANLVPTEVIFEMLGVPKDQAEDLAKDEEVRHSTSRNAAESSNKHLQDSMQALVKQRIDKPEDDLISKLVVEQLKPGNLTEEDVVNLALLVLTAGNAAMLSSIGLGIITLLSHPEQLEELKKDPSIVSSVVNELLRYNTTSALNSRRATNEDITIHGQHIPKDTGVICSVQSADRDRLDPKEPDPETFNIHRNRDPDKVLGFGYGPHRCQGEALVRQELEIVFGTLFQKLPNLKLAVDVKDVKYSPATQNASVVELPVRF